CTISRASAAAGRRTRRTSRPLGRQRSSGTSRSTGTTSMTMTGDDDWSGPSVAPGGLVCYVHINKNFGNTIRDVLDRNYGGRLAEYMVNGRRTRRADAARTVDSGDDDVRRVVDEIQRRQFAIDCLALNLPYGIHRYLNRPARYFTLLREPVDRCVSFWYWAYR